MRKRKLLLFFLVLILPILACTDFSVINHGDRTVTVNINLPDGGGGVYRIPAGDLQPFLVIDGGPFSVDVVPDEEYLGALRQFESTTLLYMATGDIDLNDPLPPLLVGANPLEAFSILITIEDMIAGEEAGAHCEGKFFETIYGPFDTPVVDTAAVTLSLSSNEWVCQ